MSNRSYDVLVAKDYETQQEGVPIKRTAWNPVGRAWRSRSSDAICFELYLIPNQRYVIQIREPDAATVQSSTFEDAPF